MSNYIKAKIAKTNSIIEVKQAAEGSEWFIDKDDNSYNIEELDFTNIAQDEQDSFNSTFMNTLLKGFDIKEQEAQRAKVAEREYWRKLRGDIFLTLLNKYKDDTTRIPDLIDSTDYALTALVQQDKKLRLP